MDALSEALASVRMTGAIFYHAECTAPWGFRVPHLEDVAHVLAPGTERLVSYHLVTHGKAVVCFPGEEDIPVTAGDILDHPPRRCPHRLERLAFDLHRQWGFARQFSGGRADDNAIGRRRRD